MSAAPEPSYAVERKNKFDTVIRSMVEYEIRPGNTVTFLHEVDLTEVERVRGEAAGTKPSYTAFVAKAVAVALKEFPYANRRVCRRWWWPFSVRTQRFSRSDVSVAAERDVPGTAVATFADVLRDADRLSLAEITEWLRKLATCDETNNQQWRAFCQLIRNLPTWLSSRLVRLPLFFPGLWPKFRGASVLISSPAKYGVDAVAATWTSPLGVSFGLVKDRPWVRDGRVVPCRTFTLTLNFDRRVMAGAQAGRFFARIVNLLERAETLLTAPTPTSAAPAEPHPGS